MRLFNKFLFVEVNNRDLEKEMYHLIPCKTDGELEELKALFEKQPMVLRMDKLDGEDRENIVQWCRLLDDLLWLNIRVWSRQMDIEKFKKDPCPEMGRLWWYEEEGSREPPGIIFGDLVESLYQKVENLDLNSV